MKRKLEPIPEYQCPQCGRKMEPGFVTANQSIRWATNEGRCRFGVWATEILKLNLWVYPRCSAVRCQDCQLVLFRY